MDNKNKVSIIRPKKKVNPTELVEEALEILNANQKNLMIKVKNGQVLNGFEIRAVHDTIKSVALLRDVQLKGMELERKLLEAEKKEISSMSDEELKEKLLKIAEKVKEKKND